MPEPSTLYFALPYPLKCLAVSVHGHRLNWERYGADAEALVEEAQSRDRWDREDLRSLQAERVRELLHHAAASVPAYRDLFDSESLSKDEIGRLSSWPILRKQVVRTEADAFISDGALDMACSVVSTSGSTGTPMQLTVDRGALRGWYALFEARWRRWHGVKRGDRWAVLGGQMVARPGRSKPPFWVWNGAMNQLYLSAYHIARETVNHYLEAMSRRNVVYLLGYPSAMAELARCAEEEGLQGPELSVVISNAEPLLPNQRHLLERFFNCPVRDTYGMAEMVAAAGECERGSLHLWPEAGLVEVLDDDGQPLPPGQVGRLVCTGLLNRAMPLIRYEVGDRGSLAPPGELCDCGRTLPILLSVEGRLDDLVHTQDGRRIGRLDTVFKADLPIRAAQIVQEDQNRLVVRLVPTRDFDDAAEEAIRRGLTDRVGEMDIQLLTVDSIAKGPGGKHRGVISKLN